jgi:hypothetical protein
VSPFQGVGTSNRLVPRALPWADVCQPFGLEDYRNARLFPYIRAYVARFARPTLPAYSTHPAVAFLDRMSECAKLELKLGR